MAKHQPIAIRLEVDVTEIDGFVKELAARFSRLGAFDGDNDVDNDELDELYVWLVDYFRSHLVARTHTKEPHT